MGAKANLAGVGKSKLGANFYCADAPIAPIDKNEKNGAQKHLRHFLAPLRLARVIRMSLKLDLYKEQKKSKKSISR